MNSNQNNSLPSGSSLVPAAENPAPPPLAANSSPHQAGTALRPLRVLLIEDDQDTRDMLQFILECLGYTVITAPDGEAGLKMVEGEHPDIFISDIRMPGLDGYSLIERIRQNPAIDSIPGIALTGFGMKSDVQRSLAAGFDAHLVKPADIDALAALMRRLTVEGHHGHPLPSS